MADNTADDGLYAESGGGRTEFKEHPAGQEQAVICDIRSLGMLPTSYQGVDTGEKPHILVTWQTDQRIHFDTEELGRELNDREKKLEGQRYIVSRRYVNSLADTARLRKDIEILLNRKLTQAELRPRGFNLESLIGLNCQVTIVHSAPKNGRVYANIQGVAPWNQKWGADLKVEGFTRFKDRDKGGGAAPSAADAKADAIGRLKALIGQGASYGLRVKGGEPDYEKMSVAEIDKACGQWGEAIDKAIAAKRQQEEDEDPFEGEPEDAPDAAPDAPSEAAADAPKPDLFAEPGEPGFLDDAAREKVLAEDRALVEKDARAKGKTALEAKRAAADVHDEVGEAVFDQKASDIVNAQWVEAGHQPLPEHVREVIDAAADAELIEAPYKDVVTDQTFIGKINKFLTSVNRKPVTTLAELKTAQGVLVKAKIIEAVIV